MAGYMIVSVDITDPTGFEEYRNLVGPTLESYWGKYLVRGTPEVVEGNWGPKRLAVLEFESVERAKQWYSSQEYISVKMIRQRTANSDALFIEGV